MASWSCLTSQVVRRSISQPRFYMLLLGLLLNLNLTDPLNLVTRADPLLTLRSE